ncbi:MAG: hypothetical protein EOO41_05180, partial [Methanobacteriota archaeon]
MSACGPRAAEVAAILELRGSSPRPAAGADNTLCIGTEAQQTLVVPSDAFAPPSAQHIDEEADALLHRSASAAPRVPPFRHESYQQQTVTLVPTASSARAAAPELCVRLPTVHGLASSDFVDTVRHATARSTDCAHVGSSADELQNVRAPLSSLLSDVTIRARQHTQRGNALAIIADAHLTQMVYTDEPVVQQAEFDDYYPRFPDSTDVRMSDAQRAMYMDMRPYMNSTPYTVHMHAPAQRAFDLFRQLALRHLLVV